MRQSELFTKTLKSVPKDEESINAKLLIRAGYIDKLMSGVYTLLPLGQKVIKKIEDIIREEMVALGGQEIYMPALQPKENWETTDRWDSLDILFKVTDASKRQFALGPTHEEIVVPLAQKFINSYRDLPKAVFQFQNKFRMELRAKSGILRAREFLMKDLYSFHLSEDDLDKFYERAVSAYKNIFNRVGIGDITHFTYASGGTFSKYSHEFQTITPDGEDTIYICNQCSTAVNKEIKDETPACPQCGRVDLKEAKAVEVGNIFKLKTKFTDAFKMTVKNEQSEEKQVLMGCYGIGIGRLMGTIVEASHDDQGIIWPEAVAPFKIHLLSIGSESRAEEVYKQLTDAGLEVLFDDRSASPGEKFADADLIGLPYRLVISPKTGQRVEFKDRKSDNVEILEVEEFLERLK